MSAETATAASALLPPLTESVLRNARRIVVKVGIILAELVIALNCPGLTKLIARSQVHHVLLNTIFIEIAGTTFILSRRKSF